MAPSLMALGSLAPSLMARAVLSLSAVCSQVHKDVNEGKETRKNASLEVYRQIELHLRVSTRRGSNLNPRSTALCSLTRPACSGYI